MYFAAMLIFCVVELIRNDVPGAIGFAAASLLLASYSYIYKSATRTGAIRTIENVLFAAESAGRGALSVMPIPTLAFSLSTGSLLWTNDAFTALAGETERLFDVALTDVLPKFSYDWLLDGKTELPAPYEFRDSIFRVRGSAIRASYDEGWGVLYFEDVSELASLRVEFAASRTAIMIIMIDNYDDFTKGLTDIEKSTLIAELDDAIARWLKPADGFLTRLERDQRVCILEERWMPAFISGCFSLLETIKTTRNHTGIEATVSIGVGRGADSPLECYKFASLAIDMALSRGGDQAVVKDKLNFAFYGGKNQAVERNTKVKSRVMANALNELITDSSDVIVMGHRFADYDVLGAAAGVVAIARILKRKVSIVLNADTCLAMPMVRKLMQLREYDGVFITPRDAMLVSNNRTLLIVVDTNRPDQVESETLLQSITRTAVIDHHRRAADYITGAAFTFHEPYASSASELVTDLLQYLAQPSVLHKLEAEAMLTGIMLDTKNFTLRTGTRTFEAAVFLRRAGADASEADKLFRLDIAQTAQKARVVSTVKMYGDGFAVSEMTDAGDRVIAAQAADALLKITGVKASFVVFALTDAACVSARSSGDVNVQLLMEKLGGGGNSNAAAVQRHDLTRAELMTQLIACLKEC
jgi:c-di-AMP phosphodiesterase-like protein